MNEIKIIDERKLLGREFRIYGDFNNPLFLAKDVAEWIEHSDTSTMVKTIDEEEKLIQTILVSGQNREVLMLTEDGLYEVLMQSRKPIAKEFKKQVKEILKSIRKHGMYATDELLDNPDLIIKMASKLKEEREKNRELVFENDAKTKRIEELRPKEIFADAVSTSKSSILIGELAKILKQNGIDTGEKRLFEWLRKNGYLIRRQGTDYNAPTQKSMELNLFEVKETSISHSDGHVTISKTTKVTGKGQVYFINKFIEKAIV